MLFSSSCSFKIDNVPSSSFSLALALSSHMTWCAKFYLNISVCLSPPLVVPEAVLATLPPNPCLTTSVMLQECPPSHHIARDRPCDITKIEPQYLGTDISGNGMLLTSRTYRRTVPFLERDVSPLFKRAIHSKSWLEIKKDKRGRRARWTLKLPLSSWLTVIWLTVPSTKWWYWLHFCWNVDKYFYICI